MINYDQLTPMQHMFCMRLTLGGLPNMLLNIQRVQDNEIWVDFTNGKGDEEKLRTHAQKCGLTEIENHHYSYTLK